MLLSQSSYNKSSARQPVTLSNHKSSSHSCQQCGMQFQSVAEMLNHKKRFCQSSGYDDLTGLLLKQTSKNTTLKSEIKGFEKKENKGNKMKNYGQYSLSKIKYDPIGQDIPINRNPVLLYDDMLQMKKHENSLQGVRHYQQKQKFLQDQQTKHGSSRASNFNSERKPSQQFGNVKSGSAFSYRLNEQNFQQSKKSQSNSNSKYLQQLLLKNQPKQFTEDLLIKPQFVKSRTRNNESLNSQTYPLPIPSSMNPASIQFRQSQKIPSLLNKSNTSIANMALQQKLTYAQFKLSQLIQVKQLYLKNGGQSKEFVKNVEKMIVFYEKLVEDCKNQGKNQLQLSQLSRPQTPIMRLNDDKLNTKKLIDPKKDINRKMPTGRPENNQFNKEGKTAFPQFSPNIFPQMFPQFGQGADPNIVIAQNYAHMYQMKVMQDMMRMKSQENRKLIEALILGKTGDKGKQSKQSSQKQPQEEKYRFANQVNTMTPSQDRILKLLQQQELDELKLLSNLPVNLQDQKIQSLIKNSQLRFKMEKQILKQKLSKLSWQEKVQSFEEERQLNNNDWVGKRNKDVIKTQQNQYLNDFSKEFRMNPGT